MQKKERNHGIDLLRLVSMLFVVILHSLLFSKALNGVGGFYRPAWFIEILFFGAVDIFGIISGYVGFRDKKKPFKLKPLLCLWGQTVFYGVAVFAIVCLIDRSIIAKNDILMHVMPLTHDTYWYLTGYVFLFLAMPMLNAWVRELTKKQCRKVFWIAFAIVAVLCLMPRDIAHLGNGYSGIWLIVLYLIGALMKKGEVLAKLKKKWCIFGILVITLAVWAMKMLLTNDIKIGSFVLSGSLFISYISPTVLLSAILFVQLFSSMKFKREKIIALIQWAAPCAFGVFLLNSHPYIRGHYTPLALSPISEIGGGVALLYLLGYSLLFFVVAIVVEKIRRVSTAWLGSKITRKIGKR